MVYPRDAKMVSVQKMTSSISELRERVTVKSKCVRGVSMSRLSKDTQTATSMRSSPDLVKVVFKTPTAGFLLHGRLGSILSPIGDMTRTPALPASQWSRTVLTPQSETGNKASKSWKGRTNLSLFVEIKIPKE